MTNRAAVIVGGTDNGQLGASSTPTEPVTRSANTSKRLIRLALREMSRAQPRSKWKRPRNSSYLNSKSQWGSSKGSPRRVGMIGYIRESIRGVMFNEVHAYRCVHLRAPVSAKSVLRLPCREQTSRLAQSGIDVAAP